MTSALITVYHPTDRVKHNVNCIAQQVDAVYICDNSPVSNEALFDGDNIRYTCFGENLGISRAFNRILKSPGLPWSGNDYVFFFDQDSVVEEKHLEHMISVYENIRQTGLKIGCLGPAYFNTSNGKVEIPKARKPIGENAYAVSGIITSSMLCTYGDLQEVGFWNEDVFLDMADWDLCWRLMKTGKLCCLTESVILRHSLGSGEKKIGPLRLRVGEPFREYYQIRECLYLLGKSYTPLKYRVRFLAMLLIRSPLHLIFLENRKERLKYITMGAMDFLKKKHGALER